MASPGFWGERHGAKQAACRSRTARNREQKRIGVRNSLDRVYHELRNLGLLPQERALNFQIVNIDSPIDGFEDAPVLFVSGNQPLKFSEEKIQKLKTYVEEGGMIVANADCSNKLFAALKS